MKITLHAVHAIPASLLNRDDQGAVKTILFGGTTRIRVSSQSWKRAMRLWLRNQLTSLQFGTRTNRLPQLVTAQLAAAGIDPDIAADKTMTLFDALGLKPNAKTGGTAVSLYVNENAAAKLADSIVAHLIDADTHPWDTVVADGLRALHPDQAIDIALFGRFLAEVPGQNVDAAACVAHAMSVDPARITADFFTAVDDQAGDDEAASSNLGTVDLAAPVLYRTASIDLDQLAANLGGDIDLTRQAAAGLVRAFTMAMPSAKAGSTAPHTLPAFVIATPADLALSFADAFVSAVDTRDVLTDATTRLIGHVGRVQGLFGYTPTVHVLPISTDPALFTALPGADFSTTLDEFANRVIG